MGSRAGFGSAGGRRPLESHQEPQPRQKQFEYNQDKSASNKKKHGIDFEEAKEIWNDSKRIEFETEHRPEVRTITVGLYNGKMYSAVTTVREGVIRIISVRRSRNNEVRLYEQGN